MIGNLKDNEGNPQCGRDSARDTPFELFGSSSTLAVYWKDPDWLNSDRDTDNWWNKEKAFEDWWEKTRENQKR